MYVCCGEEEESGVDMDVYVCPYVCAYTHKEEDLSCVVDLCVIYMSLLSDICVYQR